MFRNLPRAVWILLIGTFINRFGSFVMPFLALYLTRRGFSAAQAGVAVAAYGGGHFMASMIGGHLADRIGRRNTIVVSMFSSAAAMMALSQMTSYVPILIVTFLAGTTAEMYRPASFALIADLVTPEQRVISFSLYRFAVNLGVAAGPATAGFLADRNFFLVFAGDAITSFAYGVIAVLALPHGLRTMTKEERAGEAVRTAVRDRAFMMFLFATVLMTAVDFQSLSTLPLFVRALGHPASVFGMLLSLNALIITLFELPLTPFLRRLHPLTGVAIGYLLVGIGFAVNAGRILPALVASVVIWTAGEMFSSPLGSAYVSQIAPERFRGRYMGMWSMSWAIGMMVGPTIGTLVYARSPFALWIVSGVVGAMAAALMLRERLRPRATSR